VDISENDWETVWSLANRLSVCNRARAIQLRILNRFHITPFLRHKHNPAHSPLCPKCKSDREDYIHCVWVFCVCYSRK